MSESGNDDTSTDDVIEPDDVTGPDEVIEPDDVTGPSDSGLGDHVDGEFGIDELARRAVDVVLTILDKASKLAGAVLIFAGVACIGGFLLGVLALSGGARIAWIVLGGAAALWAIGSVVAAMFRLRAVRSGSDLLVEEVSSLISGDTASERTVIETVESTEGNDDGIVAVSRQFFSLRDTVSEHRSNFRQLSLALASITTLPGAMALATVIGFAFAAISLVFLLILIF